MTALGRRETQSMMKLLGWAAALGLMTVSAMLRDTIGLTPTLVLMALAAALAIGVCTSWFLGLDEAQRHAHYVAWFWGASFGLVAMAVFAFVGAWLGLERPDQLEQLIARFGGGDSWGAGFWAGATFVIAPMLVGHSIWWTAFWLRRR
jgi:hypothetical protein